MTSRTRTTLGVAALVAGAVGVYLLVAPLQLRPANVILITLDTTRADRLAPYGGRAGLMPTFETWAHEGVVFDDVSTLAPLTLPAHTSLLTGRTPPSHGVRDNTGVLASDVPTLAEALHQTGYRTGAFVSAVVLDRSHGLSRGFDAYGEVNPPTAPRRFRRPGNETVDDALGWLQTNAGSPFFLWVHLYDAHAPIRLPEPFRTTYADDPYDGALAFMDSQLGRIQTFLDTHGLARHTAIIVAADHGESLGDHGEAGHGIFVYQSVVHVPLIITWPDLEPGRTACAVQLIDVAPTIAALERAASWASDGRTLVPLLRGQSLAARDLYAESMYPRHFGWSELRSLRAGTLKVIDAPRPELYDLGTDPGESHNLFAAEPGTAASLLNRLRRLPGATVTLPRAPSKTARELAALGYVSTPVPSPPGAVLPDPKDMIARYNRIEAIRPPSHVGGQH
jgi:choline-sulfatase